MCEHGDEVLCTVTVDARDSHTGAARNERKAVDRCIAPLVDALNDAGIITRSSCCGHGKGPGVIILSDNRVLEVRLPWVGPSCDWPDGCEARATCSEVTSNWPHSPDVVTHSCDAHCKHDGGCIQIPVGALTLRPAAEGLSEADWPIKYQHHDEVCDGCGRRGRHHCRALSTAALSGSGATGGECSCEQWGPGIAKLNGPIVLAQARNPALTSTPEFAFTPFKFCPWCGAAAPRAGGRDG